jgi:hypothetical protein
MVYLGVVFVVSGLHADGSQLLQLVIGNDNRPGGIGHTLERLREVERTGAVDILFIGSSHAYRGFDPRLFASVGLSSFNLGSKAQSPLNTYYLLRRYWPRLQPKVVIMEVYPMALAVDGLESFYDLTVNTTVSEDMLQMALAVRNVHALNALVAAYVGGFWRPVGSLKQADVPGQTYIAGGYVESPGQADAAKPPGGRVQVELSDVQLEYLRRVIGFVGARGSRMVLVVHPLPKRTLSTLRNYRGASERVLALAGQMGVPFWDFSQDLDLDDVRDFKDLDHLNASGVRKFDGALIERMKRQGWLARFSDSRDWIPRASTRCAVC